MNPKGRIMPKIALDDFVQRLQMAVTQAQANIEEGNRGRLERLIGLAGDSDNPSLTWSFVIDGESKGMGGISAVRLPLISLRRHLTTQVAEIRLDLKAAVEESYVPQKGTPKKRLGLVINRRSTLLRRRLHRLTVRLTGRQPVTADISVDDFPLKTLT